MHANVTTAPHTKPGALTVLVVGATGSIGRLVVDEALRAGHQARALVRDASRAGPLPKPTRCVVADLTRADTLAPALDGVDAIVFTHGTADYDKAEAERVDYGAVRNVLTALQGRTVRIALMTSIGVTNRHGAFNRSTEIADWKRRGERLVRASGLPYTIVRPGWFDHHAPNQERLVFLQGDKRLAGDPSDGVVARRQIAEVLVRSLTSSAARNKTFELVAEQGPATQDFDALFGDLDSDASGALDAIRDTANLPLAAEPARVREDLQRIQNQIARQFAGGPSSPTLVPDEPRA